MSWSGNLIDLQKFPTGGIDLQKSSTGGLDIYIRLAHLEFEKERNLKVIITVTVIIGAMAIPSTAYFLWRWMTKKRANKSRKSIPSKNLNDVKLHELPTFSLEELATATNNFHVANMLGRGGFGTVYKGKLHDGQEIAVKRQSRSSGQGLEEFMNEDRVGCIWITCMSGLQTKGAVEEKALMVLLIAPEDESGTLTKVTTVIEF
ncbi:hypothetical protein CMV_003212 [Castanea mollissima]|uniref:Protein kinase domain-containing protein n=1 Tax=Castanea mollissima TaxID=60419 RepID=A0A8J4RTN9_9ROSI|nr:hypothetical protein CMV_003212 [Castanea mollissima]